MDIIITVPKTTSWDTYKEEIARCEEGEEVMNFKVPHLPKKTVTGDKCWVVYKGNILGYMIIVGFSDKPFVCSTTGIDYVGKFIQRSGRFYNLATPIPMRGFQGWRYFDITKL